MQINPENNQKFFDIDEYQSVVTPELQVIGTEDKKNFIKNYIENEEIRQKYKLIGTHSDAFHCDEIMAVSMLLRTKEFANSIIVRTRDEEILKQLDLLCDVGSEFIPQSNRFDHHQRTFNYSWWHDDIQYQEQQLRDALSKGEASQEQLDAFLEQSKTKIITKLSSAGLIYKFFGKEIIKNICKSEYEIDLSEKEIDKIYEQIYQNIILEIDAIDNGVNQGQNLKYNIQSNLSGVISRYNLPWNAPPNCGITQHTQFKKGMKICEKQFIQNLYNQVNIILPARKIVERSWDKKEEFHQSGELIFIDQYRFWIEHLYDIEKEKDQIGKIKFVIFADSRKMYRIQAVSVSLNSFDNRVSIYQKLCGLRGKELCEAAQVPDAEFVHATGFIGGAWSLQSCIKIAEDSLLQHQQLQNEKNIQ